jgi:hypothetical protein
VAQPGSGHRTSTLALRTSVPAASVTSTRPAIVALEPWTLPLGAMLLTLRLAAVPPRLHAAHASSAAKHPDGDCRLFVVARAIIMGVEWVNGLFLYPGPARVAKGMTDREALKALLANAPVGALLVVALGWMLRSLAGGCVAAWIGKRAQVANAQVLGGLLTLAGIADNLMIPPPPWFCAGGFIVFIPASYAGSRLAVRPTPQRLHT